MDGLGRRAAAPGKEGRASCAASQVVKGVAASAGRNRERGVYPLAHLPLAKPLCALRAQDTVLSYAQMLQNVPEGKRAVVRAPCIALASWAWRRQGRTK